MKHYPLSSVCLALASAWLLSQPAASSQNAVSFNLCRDLAMTPNDLAGAETRVGNWNNLKDVKTDSSTTLNTVNDHSGKPVSGMTVTVTGGSSAFNTNMVDWDQSGGDNDVKMFNGTFDQDEGTPTTIVVTNIPYEIRRLLLSS